MDLMPVSSGGSMFLTTLGCCAALLSTCYDRATVFFAVLYAHYMIQAVTNFVNHDYLFCLLSILTAWHVNSNTREKKQLVLEALRGQIVVVYFYASLWKLHPEYLNGQIVRGNMPPRPVSPRPGPHDR